MPIVTLQRRLREVGRIRIGETVPTSNGKTRPAKLDHFRLTSRDQQIIEAAAQQYGGTVRPWTAPDGQQWEVKTTVDQMPVVVPPSEMAFSQYFEQWSAGGCKVRCDGEWDYLADKACHCDPEKRACAFHTRLSVMLPDLPGVGLWRLDTSGYYAATELAGVVDLCMAAAQRGQYLPARLRLEQRRVLRDGKTNKFAVPVLDVDVHPLSLTGQRMVGPSDAVGELPVGALTPVPASLPAGPVASIAEQAASVGEPRPKSVRSNAAEPIPPTGLEPRTASEAAAGEAPPVNGGRTCALCGLLLAGPAEKVEGGYAHKGGCPPGSGPDDPGARDTDVSRAADGADHGEGTVPSATPAELDEPALAGVGSTIPAEPDVYRDIDILKLAGEVFDAARLAAPRGTKSKIVDRLRHAVAWAVTEGRTQSLKEMTAADKHRLWTELSYLQRGFNTYRVDDNALVIIHDGNEVTIPFDEVENGEAA